LRYAIISDIHANIQALQEVLKLIDTLEVDSLVCLGDIVGYGGDPSPCIELIRQRCPEVIMGNHDAAAVGLTPIDYFNPAAQEAAIWTSEVLSAQERKYLTQLPFQATFEKFEIVHSTPDDPSAWKYLMTEDEARPLFECFARQLLFYGHTHFPMVFELDQEEIALEEPFDFNPRPGARYIVNVGSVGQPRDGDPRASFAVFDTGENKVVFHRQPYDINGAQKSILRKGLPKILALRLDYGT